MECRVPIGRETRCVHLIDGTKIIEFHGISENIPMSLSRRKSDKKRFFFSFLFFFSFFLFLERCSSYLLPSCFQRMCLFSSLFNFSRICAFSSFSFYFFFFWVDRIEKEMTGPCVAETKERRTKR